MSITPNTIVNNFDLILSGFFLCITVLGVIVNVCLQYLFHGGLFWAEEVATSSFTWSVFVGFAAIYRYKIHIVIDCQQSNSYLHAIGGNVPSKPALIRNLKCC